MRHEYTLFKRFKDSKNKRGVVWFFYYYDERGKRIAKSTGKSLKGEAEEVAKAFVSDSKATTMTLQEYTKTFFIWEECLWIKRQLAKGKRFSKGVAHLRRQHLTEYILPAFGNRVLHTLNQVEIENWLISLKSNSESKAQLSNQTKNHTLYTFRIVLREAKREGLDPFNCLEHVEPLAILPKVRDTFSQKELKVLFPDDFEALLRIWKHEEYAYLFFLLATTGIRRGEARALQWRHLIGNDDRKGLYIEQAIKNDDSLGPTKNGKSRVVLINTRAMKFLGKWKEDSPFKEGDDYIFYGSNGKRPIMGKTLQNRFRKALENTKIDTKNRNLVIHSFRHTYNTLLRPILPRDILQSTTGHSSDSMTEHYNHPSIKDNLNQIAHHKAAFDNLF